MLHDSALYKFTIDIHIDIDCDVIQEVVKRLLGVTLRVQCRSKSSTAVSPSRPSSPPGDAVLSQLLIRRRFANIGADSIGDGDTLPLTFTNGWAREGGGRREWKNSKQETHQTVLTITKALTKTTNCTRRTKK